MLKNAQEDHQQMCGAVDKKTCRTCSLDMDVLDQWTTIHRGSTVLKENHGKTIKEIVDGNQWITDKDDGSFVNLTQ